MAGLAAAIMSGGSKLCAAGPACEKAHSPNLELQNVRMPLLSQLLPVRWY